MTVYAHSIWDDTAPHVDENGNDIWPDGTPWQPRTTTQQKETTAMATTLRESWSGTYHVIENGEYIGYVWQFKGDASRRDLDHLIGRWYLHRGNEPQEGFATKEEAAARVEKQEPEQ